MPRIGEQLKRCLGYKKIKAVSCYYQHKEGWYEARCKTCHNARSKNRIRTDRDRQHNRVYALIQRNKRIAEGDLDFILREKLRAGKANARIGGYAACSIPLEELKTRYTTICQICSTEVGPTICLDHDHLTGAFRGFLCMHCNRMLGSAKDSAECLIKGAEYLRSKQ